MGMRTLEKILRLLDRKTTEKLALGQSYGLLKDAASTLTFRFADTGFEFPDTDPVLAWTPAVEALIPVRRVVARLRQLKRVSEERICLTLDDKGLRVTLPGPDISAESHFQCEPDGSTGMRHCFAIGPLLRILSSMRCETATLGLGFSPEEDSPYCRMDASTDQGSSYVGVLIALRT